MVLETTLCSKTAGLLPCFDADIKHPLLKKETLSFSSVALSLSGNVQRRPAAGMRRPLLDRNGAEGREPSEKKRPISVTVLIIHML
jgi:hypothetical protein